MIGIDKTVIKNFHIERMDVEKLISNSNVELYTEGVAMTVPTTTGNMQDVAYLKIKDGQLFNELIAGVKIKNGQPNPYFLLVLSIKNVTGNNLAPLKKGAYMEMVNEVVQYIEDKYGLYLNIDNIKFHELEVNVTMELKDQFVDWEYLLRIMRRLAPKRYKLETEYSKNKNFTGIVLSNGSLECKIYDKTRQLQDTYKLSLDKQYLRIEYRFLNAEKVARALGTNLVRKVNDEAIVTFLKKQIEKDILKPIRKHITSGDKLLYKLAKAERLNNKRGWVKLFVAKAQSLEKDKVPVLLDVEQIESVIEKLSGPSNYQAVLRRQDNTLSEIKEKYSNFSKLNYLENNIC